MTLAELYAALGPADGPYCTNCWGFGFVKEDNKGNRASLGWLGCSECGGRQRRPQDVIAYNEAWTRERKNAK